MTGVQTCALPIYHGTAPVHPADELLHGIMWIVHCGATGVVDFSIEDIQIM